MIISIQAGEQIYKIDVEKPLDIAIALDFDGIQPNAYGVERASSTPCEAEGIIGNTRRGGSCNFEQVKFIPHCNGTHTECVGHITNQRISVHKCLKDAFVLSRLISVKTEKAGETNENYPVKLSENDQLITRNSLEKALQEVQNLASDNSPFQGLIIRTLPNDDRKLSQTYLEKIPPFFSTGAMQFIREIGIRHLLVDTPSIDRIFDEGQLSNHRIFWNVEQGSYEASANSFIERTITELIYVPETIADGHYLLNLQIAPFAADASPSRPVIFKIIEES